MRYFGSGAVALALVVSAQLMIAAGEDAKPLDLGAVCGIPKEPVDPDEYGDDDDDEPPVDAGAFAIRFINDFKDMKPEVLETPNFENMAGGSGCYTRAAQKSAYSLFNGIKAGGVKEETIKHVLNQCDSGSVLSALMQNVMAGGSCMKGRYEDLMGTDDPSIPCQMTTYEYALEAGVVPDTAPLDNYDPGAEPHAGIINIVKAAVKASKEEMRKGANICNGGNAGADPPIAPLPACAELGIDAANIDVTKTIDGSVADIGPIKADGKKAMSLAREYCLKSTKEASLFTTAQDDKKLFNINACLVKETIGCVIKELKAYCLLPENKDLCVAA